MNDSSTFDQRVPESVADSATPAGPVVPDLVPSTSAPASDGGAQNGAVATGAPARRRASRPTAAASADAANGGTATATPAAEPTAGARTRTSGGSLSAKLLPELQQIASGLGITGVARLRKGQLITAIQEARAATSAGNGVVSDAGNAPASDASATKPEPTERARTGSAPAERADAGGGDGLEAPAASGRDGGDRADRGDRAERSGRPSSSDRERSAGASRSQGGSQNGRGEGGSQNTGGQGGNGPGSGGNDGDFEGRRGRRGRYRDRRRGRDRGQSGYQNEPEPQIREDDVLAPVAGILDTADNYAFLRTSGYLAGPNDVYVSMNLVRRHNLRRGDALTGMVKANANENEHQGNRREKYTPLVRLDTVNGVAPDEAKNRPEFHKLVPLYPQERLRLETDPTDLVTRVIDILMPIGKGQRALIVSPPKAGKTTVLQRIANAITQNNPECHLMVVLVDERPEEVTDMQRSVKGEVIASTFDRPAQDHTTVAELSIERAKRLVEQGHDVVVLLDSITRLGRAYNLAAPASGRILSGGVDSTALYPPKRFLGAARNIENGGSLTILATALVETGSMMDTVIFEEFKGTGNAELKLDRKIADKRVFPAVDIDASGTRKEELLMSSEEMAIVHKLRRVLHSLESQAAIDLLISKLKETRTNIEFLMQIAKTTPGE